MRSVESSFFEVRVGILLLTSLDEVNLEKEVVDLVEEGDPGSVFEVKIQEGKDYTEIGV